MGYWDIFTMNGGKKENSSNGRIRRWWRDINHWWGCCILSPESSAFGGDLTRFNHGSPSPRPSTQRGMKSEWFFSQVGNWKTHEVTQHHHLQQPSGEVWKKGTLLLGTWTHRGDSWMESRSDGVSLRSFLLWCTRDIQQRSETSLFCGKNPKICAVFPHIRFTLRCTGCPYIPANLRRNSRDGLILPRQLAQEEYHTQPERVVDSTVHWWSLMDQKRWKRDRTRLSRMHITSCEHTSCKKTIPKLCHSCTISAKIFVTVKGHSGGALWWGTPVGHSGGALLQDTFWQKTGLTLSWDTPVRHFCETLLWDTLGRHYREEAPVGGSRKALFENILLRHSCKTLRKTLS